MKSLVENNGTPMSYYENNDAYLVTPAYKQASESFQLASDIESTTAQQKEKLANGAQSVQLFKGYDQATGQPVYEATPVTEQNMQHLSEQLAVTLHQAGEAKANSQAQAVAVQQGHIKRFEAVTSKIRENEKSYFPFYEDDSPAMTKEIKKDITDFVQQLPQEVQTSPLAAPLAKAYRLIKDMNINMQALKRQQPGVTVQQGKVVTNPNSDQNLAGPTGQAVAGSGGSSHEEVFADADWVD